MKKLIEGLHLLYEHAKALFDLVAPQEYGFDAEAKEEIGILTSLPLLRKIVSDLEEAKTTGKSLACFYFTYVASGDPANRQQGESYHHFAPPRSRIWTAHH